VVGLESEKINWCKNIESLKKDEETIIGDCLLSSSIMSYFGIFPKDYRDETQLKWK